MSESILVTTKDSLDLPETVTVFDGRITMYINSAFSTLNQLGLGPEGGYMITGPTDTWDAFIENDPRLNSVKTFIFISVKLLFDPPQTSYLIESLKTQLEELTWRLNVKREGEEWTAPTTSL